MAQQDGGRRRNRACTCFHVARIRPYWKSAALGFGLAGNIGAAGSSVSMMIFCNPSPPISFEYLAPRAFAHGHHGNHRADTNDNPEQG